MAAGALHSCALLADGTVTCWGDNSAGQLGIGSTRGGLLAPGATALGSGSGVIQPATPTARSGLAAGAFDTCVVLTGGAAKCWGADNSGQIGNGAPSTPAVNVPTNVLSSISGAVYTSITVGARHTCATLNNGTTVGIANCWGDDSNGELGDGFANSPSTSTPFPVIGLNSGVAQISAGDDFTCAATVTGHTLCWGAPGFFGNDLGNGSQGSFFFPDFPYPVDVI